MKKQKTERKNNPKQNGGFSLIELLVVIGVIVVLIGLLLPALSIVKQRAKVIEARKDVNQIEAALNEYLATYRRWPLLGEPATPGGPIKVADDMAELLISGAYDDIDNTKRLTFMSFKRINESGSPITPWGNEDFEDASEDDKHYYWVMLDTDFDNVIIGCDCFPSIVTPLSNDVNRSVIAWTANTDADPSEEAFIIGSWEQ